MECEKTSAFDLYKAETPSCTIRKKVAFSIFSAMWLRSGKDLEKIPTCAIRFVDGGIIEKRKRVSTRSVCVSGGIRPAKQLLFARWPTAVRLRKKIIRKLKIRGKEGLDGERRGNFDLVTENFYFLISVVKFFHF